MMTFMEPLDPENERIRLLVRYSSMADQQLENLAADWESLTFAARLALKQEMKRRDMHIEFEEKSAPDHSNYYDEESTPETYAYSGEFITIREVDTRGEAMVVEGLLESAGVKTLLVNTLNLPLDSMPLEDGWPIRLQVRKENAERAIEILTNLNRDNDPD